MKKFLFLFCLFILVFAGFAGAENVYLRLKNINTDESIDNVVVYVNINSHSFMRHVGEGKTLELDLAEGTHTLEFKIDKPSTPGKDYFKKQPINAGNNLEEDVYLFPVGSLRGMVKDLFDNIVGDAELRFECTNEIGRMLPEKTNKFGSFIVDYMPTGSCKIFASLGEAVGFTEVDVVQGNITDVEISLDKTILVIPSRGYGVEGFVLLLFIAAVVLSVLKYKDKITKKQKKQVYKKPASEQKQETKHDRAKDILATLNKKEKNVAEFLMGKEEVNQSNIRHNTGIPRTSLSRVLSSLEQKKIILVKKVGKAVKVKLTDWFLGKE